MEKHHNTCITNDCPAGIESVRNIGLTSEEKRAIFLSIVGEDGSEAKVEEQISVLSHFVLDPISLSR